MGSRVMSKLFLKIVETESIVRQYKLYALHWQPGFLAGITEQTPAHLLIASTGDLP
jgi:hypothetical protein